MTGPERLLQQAEAILAHLQRLATADRDGAALLAAKVDEFVGEQLEWRRRVENRLVRQTAVQAAIVATMRGQDAMAAYIHQRELFRQAAPALFDPLEWGDRPAWLAALMDIR